MPLDGKEMVWQSACRLVPELVGFGRGLDVVAKDPVA
jgi:hypothetical protein